MAIITVVMFKPSSKVTEPVPNFAVEPFLKKNVLLTVESIGSLVFGAEQGQPLTPVLQYRAFTETASDHSCQAKNPPRPFISALMSGCSCSKLSTVTRIQTMAAGSLDVSTGSEPSSKTAGQRNASSDSAHKKSPVMGLHS